MRVATIDIGTNTTLLLIAERDERGELVAVVERAEITRLGQGVDQSRALLPEAVERTLACLRDYASQIAASGVDALDVAGTSAMRDAGKVRSGDEGDFVGRAAEILGVAPRVISGEEEASLTFSGGLLGLGLAGRVTAFDIGGGSTELIRGVVEKGRTLIEHRTSLDIGSVRLFERHIRSDPPSEPEMSVVRAFVHEQLSTVEPPPAGTPLIGMAGTVTTLATIARAIDPYDSTRVHGMRLGAPEIAKAARQMALLPLSKRQKTKGLDPKRADVIPIGAAIVEGVLGWGSADEIIVSDRGVRWGLALQLMERAKG